MARRQADFNPLNSIIGIAIFVFILVALYFLARAVFRLLYFIAPVLLIITLIIDYKVVVNYGKWIIRMLKENTVVGVIALLITVFAFPVVSAFLFGKAMLGRQIGKMERTIREKRKGEYVEYEELELDDRIELPKPEEREKEKGDYEQFFE